MHILYMYMSCINFICYFRIRANSFKRFFDDNPDSLLRIIQVKIQTQTGHVSIILCLDNNATSSEGDILSTEPVPGAWTGATHSGKGKRGRETETETKGETEGETKGETEGKGESEAENTCYTCTCTCIFPEGFSAFRLKHS